MTGNLGPHPAPTFAEIDKKVGVYFADWELYGIANENFFFANVCGQNVDPADITSTLSLQFFYPLLY